jgi:ribonucleoside-diphosphate reductase alpha chain
LLISKYRRSPNKTKFIGTVESISFCGNEDVYDCTVDTVHAFDANGFYSHNCVEVGMVPKLLVDGLNDLLVKFSEDVKMQGNDKELSGWEMCNLCELNVKKAKNKEEFFEMCRAGAILGTIQAAYTDFGYLGKVSEAIVEKEALLGISMTGMADNPDIAFNPQIQKDGAKLILEINERLSSVMGINPCARSTCIKPAGSTSCLLGTASGIHPHHATRYFRRVQANKLETPLQYFQKYNPTAAEESVWSNNKTDMVITFLCEVPAGAKTKNQMDAISLLENVKLTQQNWVEYGTRHDKATWPWVRQNVSNTISVRPEEWDIVSDYIYKNRKWFAGISLLPISGDKDYPQAPFTAVFTSTEIVREYGDASIFASGLIVDGLRAFDNNLWAGCDCVLGVGEIITLDMLREKIRKDCENNGENWKAEGLSPKSPDKLLLAWLEHNVKNYEEKVDWVRRAKQFALRYFQSDERKMTYCLKDVINWKTWCDLSREYKDVDWDGCFEDEYGNLESYGESAGGACAGGACDLGELGAAIKEKQRQNKQNTK